MLPQGQSHIRVHGGADALDATAAREAADVTFCHAFDGVAEDLSVRNVSTVITYNESELCAGNGTRRAKMEVNTYRCLFAVLLFPFPNPTPTTLALTLPNPMSERKSG